MGNERVRLRDEKGRFVSRQQHEKYHDSNDQLSDQLGSFFDSIEGASTLDIAEKAANIQDAIMEHADLAQQQKVSLLEKVRYEIAAVADSSEEHRQFYDGYRQDLLHTVYPRLLGDALYRACASRISDIESTKKSPLGRYDEDAIMQHASICSRQVLGAVFERFSDEGLMRTTASTGEDGEPMQAYYVPNKTARRNLANDTLGERSRWSRIATIAQSSDDKPKKTALAGKYDAVDELYRRHNEETRVAEIAIRTRRDGYCIYPLNEMRIGHQDAHPGLQRAAQALEGLADMPEEDKPDSILLTNLIQGGFKHSQSNRRSSLARGLDKNSAQFAVARQYLEQAQQVGVPVLLALGPADHKIAYDYTIEVLQELKTGLRSGAKNKQTMHYADVASIDDDDAFLEHYNFQLDYMIPLCYRLGRTMRTAQEINSQTGLDVKTSEYYILYEHIKTGAPLPPELGISPEDIKKLGECYADMGELYCVDDVNIIFESPDGTQKKVEYRHSSGSSAEALRSSSMPALRKELGVRAVMGNDDLALFMTGSEQEGGSVMVGETAVAALPGLTDPRQSQQRRPRNTVISGDPSRKASKGRKRLWTPAIQSAEQLNDGRMRYNIYNDTLLEKSLTIPRTAIFEMCDIQMGSPTARPDLQIKALMYMLETAKEMPVALAVAGDIVQGNIYPNFAYESQAIGLVRIDSQKEMVRNILLKTFDGAPNELIEAVVSVVVQQGNHDEEKKIRTPGNHSANIDYLVHTMKDIFSKDQIDRVEHAEMYHTHDGTPVATWRAVMHLGAYSIAVAHYHKGRGGGARSPVQEAYDRAIGLAGAEKMDIFLGAHYHNPQHATYGDTVSVVGGAMAGRSEFDDSLGYDCCPTANVVYIGSDDLRTPQPVTIEFAGKQFLDAQPVSYGYFTQESLADDGFCDDKDFDPQKHGLYSNDDRPKSALQKSILALSRRASQRADGETYIDNPNRYAKDGTPQAINGATQRAFDQVSQR